MLDESNKLMISSSPVIPACLARTAEDFSRRLKFAEDVSNSIHIDVVDGEFCSGESLSVQQWGKLSLNYVEAHLMVSEPIKYLEALKQHQVTRAIFHLESNFDLDQMLSLARSLDLLLGVAINPDTDLNKLKAVAESVNYIQLMGVYPGKTGQQQLSQTDDSLRFLRSTYNRKTLTVDGGVNLDSASRLRDSGADFIVASSFLYDKGDWHENYQKLVSVFKPR